MKQLYVLCILCLLTVFLVSCGSKESEVEDIYFVSISINPKVDMILDKNEKVTELLLLNEDAEILLADTDLTGLSIDEALNTLLDAAVETGYIDVESDENIISFLSFDSKESLTYQSQIEEKIKAYLTDEKIGAAVFNYDEITHEVKTFSELHEISLALAKLMLDYQVLHPEVLNDDLLAMEMSGLIKDLKEDMETAYHAYEDNQESNRLTIRNEMISELGNLNEDFRQQANQASYQTPDLDDIKANVLMNYEDIQEEIQNRNIARKSYYEAKRSGTIAEFLVGEYTFEKSSEMLPYIVNYHNIQINDDGSFREWFSWSSREVSQTTSQDMTHTWEYLDDEIVVYRNTLTLYFQVENGRVIYEQYDGTKLYFNKVS